MFERMEIVESIYEDVVEPYYKSPTKSDANCAGIRSQTIWEVASSNTNSKVSKSAGMRRKSYAEHYKDILQLSCLIYDPGY